MYPGLDQPSDVVLSIKEAGVAVLQLNRPLKRNALSQNLIRELTGALQALDRDVSVRSVVLTSIGLSPFSAGADLKELSGVFTAEPHHDHAMLRSLVDLETAFGAFRKPVIAAVRGFAFGGGFEIALMCDMILAAADAQFGFPEIRLGTIPGAGGTQRLTKAVGKHKRKLTCKAMELVLTGRPTTAAILENLGLVNQVCLEDDLLDESIRLAEVVAASSAPVIGLAKQAVKAAEATKTLNAGLEIERALYYSTFSLEDCHEGISAFLEKRRANFQHR